MSTTRLPPLEKEAFLQQYVLNRAHSKTELMYGETAAREAVNAWNYIRESCNRDTYEERQIHEKYTY